ncbi:type II toxin-antitoxin system VapC family toxin [Sinorhizobium sp. BJ1]|uniref:type II toxin-antitoxin system VapC family toxin n=1 Tax=Sinorhizobium sp. BJ1 TaxID=2035455 RepID=UPI000BEACC15|nr:type II toxin-antitoxin system VapC family toxin [Sinorhizobium sp. BJ1]PDT81683.1 VapC toxin family PIN domain ribonuclease [Sinorhizobium sp. BJ1]
MRLADTGIWIDHFRQADPQLIQTIENDLLLCHPAIVGELALGSLKNRMVTLGFLAVQREVIVATHDEVMSMINEYELYSMGIGYTDAHLLASTLIDSRAELWTRDKRLRRVAERACARVVSDGTATN